MRRRAIYTCLALIALVALALPAGASARKKKSKSPSITRVTPMRLPVGGKLTIRGKRFSSKRRRNTVIFLGPGRRTAFAKPKRASSRKLVVIVPAGAGRALGSRRTARFKLRVIVRRRNSRWTSKRLSPVVLSSRARDDESGASPSACVSGDTDGDLLSGSTELRIGTDPCLSDTDGDGVQDGYEFQSAKDLNNDEDQQPNTSLPYPGKRPYPNPLDPSDANYDFDGDSLTLAEEQRLWRFSDAAPRTLMPLSYSDGEQYSIYRKVGDRRVPDLPAAGYAKHVAFVDWTVAHGYRNVVLSDGPPWYSSLTQGAYGLFDVNRSGAESAREQLYYDFSEIGAPSGDGYLSDNERDEDGDGLTNYDESHGRLLPRYWDSCYSNEQPYIVAYSGTNMLDNDSDGDGIPDGADDQDHDDVPNVMEVSRVAAFNKFGASYPNDPIEGGGDDREAGKSCKAARDVTSATPDPPVWHQSAYGRVNPFNPCLPAGWSRTCPRYVEFGREFAPFDGSSNWYALN